MFKEAFAANKIKTFCGILNGTSNYILTKMKNEKIDFSVALKQAQEAGYAESDPVFDVEGIDTAHKLTILAAIASSTKPQFDNVYVEGITKITIDDINFADEFGYKIKLLGIYKNDGEALIQVVYPAFVSKDSRIASVDDSFNAVFTQGSNCGDSFVVGRGAGGFETASAIIADLIDMACKRYSYEFGVKVENLKTAKIKKIQERKGKYFLRVSFDKNSKKDMILSNEFLEKIAAQQSYFYEKNDRIFCGIITDKIVEEDFLTAFQELVGVDDRHFIRVEEI